MQRPLLASLPWLYSSYILSDGNGEWRLVMFEFIFPLAHINICLIYDGVSFSYLFIAKYVSIVYRCMNSGSIIYICVCGTHVHLCFILWFTIENSTVIHLRVLSLVFLLLSLMFIEYLFFLWQLKFIWFVILCHVNWFFSASCNDLC